MKTFLKNHYPAIILLINYALTFYFAFTINEIVLYIGLILLTIVVTIYFTLSVYVYILRKRLQEDMPKRCKDCPALGETKLWCCNHCGKPIEEF